MTGEEIWSGFVNDEHQLLVTCCPGSFLLHLSQTLHKHWKVKLCKKGGSNHLGTRAWDVG